MKRDFINYCGSLGIVAFFPIQLRLSFHHWHIRDITGWRRQSVTLVRQMLLLFNCGISLARCAVVSDETRNIAAECCEECRMIAFQY